MEKTVRDPLLGTLDDPGQEFEAFASKGSDSHKEGLETPPEHTARGRAQRQA